MNELNPPGMVQRAERSLDEIAVEIKEHFHQAESHEKEGAAQYRIVGQLLLKAKARIPHGQWLKWVEERCPFGKRHAQRYMELGKSDVTSLLEEQWRIICGNTDTEQGGQAQEGTSGAGNTPPPPPANPPAKLCCRPCRVSGKTVPTPGCKGCEEMNAPPPEPVAEEAADEPPAPNGDPKAGAWTFCKLCNEKGYAKGCLMCRLLNGRDMTPEEQAEHAPDPEAPKPPPSLIKKLEKAYAALWGVYRAIGRQFDLAVGKSVIDPENHPSMKAMIEAHAALKERTKRFIWEHQKKRQQKKQHK